MTLTREKLEQASALLAASDLGAWVVFVRETASGSDPMLPLVSGVGLTWQSALVLGRDGTRVAVVGNYDADPLVASGDWTRVVPYVEDIRGPLLETLESVVPVGGTIGLNYSLDDDKADGLTHGLFLVLTGMTRGTRFEGTFVSAAALASRLRGEKTTGELARIQAAIKAGDDIFDDIARFARPGVSERSVFDHVHALMRERGLGHAWDAAGDPIVNSGPDSMSGHGVPSETIVLSEGHVFHVDLGVVLDGYSSDVQRCWFVGSEVPDDVTRALAAVNRAIDAAAAALRPGTQGWQVDDAARSSIVASGYPEYRHAVGHQVGRLAHDGGTLLGPRWPRYGSTPLATVRENEVYTLELGVDVLGRGYLGIEEMVRVTAGGCEFLTQRQTSMPLLR